MNAAEPLVSIVTPAYNGASDKATYRLEGHKNVVRLPDEGMRREVS